REIRKLVSLNSDQEERRRSLLLFQNIENLRRPLGIRSIVKRDRQLILARSITSHPVRFWQRFETLIGDLSRRGIYRDRACSVGGPSFDPQNFPIALHIDILS